MAKEKYRSSAPRHRTVQMKVEFRQQTADEQRRFVSAMNAFIDEWVHRQLRREGTSNGQSKN
jgi:hypothetical protein